MCNKQKIVILLIVVFVSTIKLHANEPNWHIRLKQIKPLVSLKEDVEKAFAFPKIRKSFVDEGIEAVFYDTAEGELSVEYSAGNCSTEEKNYYNLKKGVVVSIVFFPKKEIKFSKFNVNKNQLVKTRDGDDPPWHYINYKLGFDYAVQNGKVIHVKFYSPAEIDKLKCKQIL
jgi:hypothetical protein